MFLSVFLKSYNIFYFRLKIVMINLWYIFKIIPNFTQNIIYSFEKTIYTYFFVFRSTCVSFGFLSHKVVCCSRLPVTQYWGIHGITWVTMLIVVTASISLLENAISVYSPFSLQILLADHERRVKKHNVGPPSLDKVCVDRLRGGMYLNITIAKDYPLQVCKQLLL